MTPDMAVVAEVQNLEATEYRVRAGVADGATLRWRVVAHTPDGSTLSSGLLPVSLQQGTAPPAALAGQADEAAIRNLIAAYQRFLETRDMPMLRAIQPGITTVELNDFQAEIRAADLQEVAIEVKSVRIMGAVQ